MMKQKQSTMFKFILTEQQIFNNLDVLKMNNYERFIQIGETGKQIQALAKSDEAGELQKLIDQNTIEIPFLKMEIEDAFVSAFHLRNQSIIEYFLKNGIFLDQIIPDAVISVCYTLQYLSYDPPLQLLKLVLEYGGNARYAQEENSDTPIHVACRYGNLDFVKMLVEYGCDINAVNNDKMTPLGLAKSLKKAGIVSFLESKNASDKWNA